MTAKDAAAVEAKIAAQVRLDRDVYRRPAWWVKLVEEQMRATDPRALLREPACYRKHWIPTTRDGRHFGWYLDLGQTCPYCGWKKKPKP